MASDEEYIVLGTDVRMECRDDDGHWRLRSRALYACKKCGAVVSDDWEAGKREHTKWHDEATR